MLKKILIVIAILILAILGVASTQPDDFKVERSISINAPVDIVFNQINDFHNWQAWSPWAKLDPQAKNTHEGAPAGNGAMFSWDGNKDVGAGKMTIVESNPHSIIRIKLDFEKPMKSTSDTVFNFQHQNDNTVVTWTMTGKNSFIGRLMCLFMSMDKMVGGQFERGLLDIKAISEAAKNATEAPATPATPDSH